MNSGNPILDKNLSCIAKYNRALVEEILAIKELKNNIAVIETALQEPNLSYNNLPIHSQDGAEKEAQELFATIQNTKMSRHIILGMGLGYLFQEVCQNSKGVVFLHEPNLEILRVTLEIADFSKELAQKNVFVFSDFKKFSELYGLNARYKEAPSLFTLNSYKEILGNDGLNEIVLGIKNITDGYDTAFEFNKKISSNTSNFFKGLPLMTNYTPLKEIENLYKGKTALMVSAGPTLDLNIETIKKNIDKVVIFCTAQAYKALYKAGIMPDFVNVIETGDFSSQLKDVDISKVNLILEPYTNYAFHELKTKQKFLFPSKNNLINEIWSDFTGIDLAPYKVLGTVSHAAMSCAKMLGCSKIILVGQDLAFLNNKCYSSTCAYGGLEYDVKQDGEIEFKVNNRVHNVFRKELDTRVVEEKKNVAFVKGITGEMLPTLKSYAAFVEFFTDFANENPNLELINSSMIGAQIDGFKNIPLEKALENAKSIEKLDLSKLDIDFQYNFTRISKKLKETKSIINSLLPRFFEGKELIQNCEQELIDKNLLDDEIIQSEKQLKSITDILSLIPNAKQYLDLFEKDLIQKQKDNPEYFTIKFECTQKLLPIYMAIKQCSNAAFKAYSLQNELEVEYILESSETYTPKEILSLFSRLKDYFFNLIFLLEKS